jgi:ABC-type glycerol-3-phosphate transport system substrate-binding protein
MRKMTTMLAIGATALFFTACGGGGSSSGDGATNPPPSNTPPPVNETMLTITAQNVYKVYASHSQSFDESIDFVEYI